MLITSEPWADVLTERAFTTSRPFFSLVKINSKFLSIYVKFRIIFFLICQPFIFMRFNFSSHFATEPVGSIVTQFFSVIPTLNCSLSATYFVNHYWPPFLSVICLSFISISSFVFYFPWGGILLIAFGNHHKELIESSLSVSFLTSSKTLLSKSHNDFPLMCHLFCVAIRFFLFFSIISTYLSVKEIGLPCLQLPQSSPKSFKKSGVTWATLQTPLMPR